MYRGLEGVQGELLLKKFPLHVLPQTIIYFMLDTAGKGW